jgi:type VI secretion system protein ImpF
MSLTAVSEPGLEASLLDRLLDDPARREAQARGASLAEIRGALVRDLGNLLNTRHDFTDVVHGYTELSKSLLVYGLPDLTQFSPRNNTDCDKLRRLIEASIRTFEPRLTGISVTMLPAEEKKGALRFRVDARLRTRPRPTRITFDTVLEAGPNAFKVTEA